VDPESSLLEFDGGKPRTAIHETLEGHLFTLLTVDKPS
jgi:hypothetical protein